MKTILITIGILLALPAQASTWQVWDVKTQILTVHKSGPSSEICYQGHPDLYQGECDRIPRILAKVGVDPSEVDIVVKDEKFLCGSEVALGCFEIKRILPKPRISVFGNTDREFELVLLHELAHYLYPDYSENQADQFALDNYRK